MADYYPLIARAIAGLDPSAPGESRRALYERARAALIAQLRSVQPPLSESEITRERLSLEEAVRKVESEAAQRAREASRPGGARAASGGDAFRRANARHRRRRQLRPPPPVSAAPASAVAAVRDAASAAGEGPRRRAICAPTRRRRRRRVRSRRSVPMQDPLLPPTRERSGAPRRGPENSAPQMPQPPGMRGFRDIAADADDLGRAAAQANRTARKTYANVPSPSPEFDRLEPSMENRGADPDAPYSYDESLEEADRYAPQPPPMQPPPQRSRIGSGRRSRAEEARAAPARYFRSRARSRSASC